MYMSGKLLVTRKPVKGILCGKVYSLVQKGENFAPRASRKSETQQQKKQQQKKQQKKKLGEAEKPGQKNQQKGPESKPRGGASRDPEKSKAFF